MKKAYVKIDDGYNDLDKLIIKNGWSIEYDTKSALESRIFYVNIIIKDNNNEIVFKKIYDATIGTAKMDQIIYGEILQIIRERKLNQILND